MDLRVFFQKIKQVEREIAPEHVVMTSLETPDGGVAGKTTEVTRAVAARLIVEGKAQLASVEETELHFKSQAALRQEAEELALSQKITINLVPQGADAQRLTKKPPKD